MNRRCIGTAVQSLPDAEVTRRDACVLDCGSPLSPLPLFYGFRLATDTFNRAKSLLAKNPQPGHLCIRSIKLSDAGLGSCAETPEQLRRAAHRLRRAYELF